VLQPSASGTKSIAIKFAFLQVFAISGRSHGSARKLEPAMNLLDVEFLLERFETCLTADEVGETLASAIRTYGFVSVAAGQSASTPEGTEAKFFFNTWPADWLKTYQERNYVNVDPLPLHARLSDAPFTWREWIEANSLTSEQRSFTEWVFGLGVLDGFVVPVRYPGDDVGLCVTLADRHIESASEKRALHLASLYALQRCRSLSAPSIPARGKSPLTDRESTCMRWVLEGKSDRDIADILGISHTTVHFHVEQVKRKLGVRTRMQAARIIMSLGYA
jgi:LuxR family quorum sensing-dependent transcriptional regulator